MKAYKKVIFGITAFLSASAAFAGGQKGNGGGVHFCPNRADQVEFYDLYEGREAKPEKPIPVYKTLPSDSVQYQSEVLDRLNELNPFFAQEVEKWLRFVQSQGTVLPFDKKLRIIPDANYLWVDQDCEYRQLANWNDEEDRIYVNSSIYDAIKSRPRDLLAFQFHEAVYKAARVFGTADNSDLVRNLVAYLFSPINPNEKVEILFGNSQLKRRPDLGEELDVSVDGGKLKIHLGKVDPKKHSLTGIRFTITNTELKFLDEELARLKALRSSASRRERKDLDPQIAALHDKYFRSMVSFSKNEDFKYFNSREGYSFSREFKLTDRQSWIQFASDRLEITAISLFSRIPKFSPYHLKVEKMIGSRVVDSVELKIDVDLKEDVRMVRAGDMPYELSVVW